MLGSQLSAVFGKGLVFLRSGGTVALMCVESIAYCPPETIPVTCMGIIFYIVELNRLTRPGRTLESCFHPSAHPPFLYLAMH